MRAAAIVADDAPGFDALVEQIRILESESIIGNGLRGCSPAGRATEVVLVCNILDQMTGLGRPMSYRIGR